MSKIRWLLAALVVAAIGLVPVLAANSSASADPGTILKFDVMTPVTGPYVGTMNQIRMVPGGINRCHRGAAPPLDIVVGIPAGRPDVPAVETLLRPQIGLGQRRTTEGNTRFPADKHHRRRETLLPESRGGVAAREATADDHNRVPC